TFALQPVDAHLRVVNRKLERVLATRDLDALLNAFGRVLLLKSRRLAVIKRRRPNFISVIRITVGQFLDMFGNAENLLNENKPAAPRTLRLHLIDADLRAIGHLHWNHFAAWTHDVSPFGRFGTKPLPMKLKHNSPFSSRPSLRLFTSPSSGRDFSSTFSTISVE